MNVQIVWPWLILPIKVLQYIEQSFIPHTPHAHSNVEQILAEQGEFAKRVDDSTIELTPEDLAGVHKLSAALGKDSGEDSHRLKW